MNSDSNITALSPLDGRYANRMEEMRKCCSEYALIRNRVKVEVFWLLELCQNPEIPECRQLMDSERARIQAIADRFAPEDAREVKEIEKRTNHDLKAVEYYLKQKIENSSLEDISEFIHFGCTSEDINNLAYALMIKEGLLHLRRAQREIIGMLATLAEEFKGLPMLSRTHGQTASPTTLGKELAVFVARLRRQSSRIDSVAIMGKMNGAVGNYNAHLSAYPDLDWPAIARRVIEDQLGLKQNSTTTQIESQDYMVELFDGLRCWNTILIDFNRDIWSYISRGYFKQKLKAGEVGSSTMPHKVNPIDFENSEGNSGLANSILDYFSGKLPISRLQRDLSNSTVLRNIGVAFGHSLLAYRSSIKGIGKLQVNREQIAEDLSQSWEVLAEPIQTVMRKHRIEKPYEKLKKLTRGAGITAESLSKFIEELDLPEEDMARLRDLTPATYVGMASKLVEQIGLEEE